MWRKKREVCACFSECVREREKARAAHIFFFFFVIASGVGHTTPHYCNLLFTPLLGIEKKRP